MPVRRRVVITGVAGFIGSNLADRLFAEGFAVVGIDTLRYGVPEQATPTGAAWLDLVDRWLAEITTQQLGRGVHRGTREHEAAIHRPTAETNKAPKPCAWSKTADEIVAGVARFLSTDL